jgi:hypothetical protein
MALSPLTEAFEKKISAVINRCKVMRRDRLILILEADYATPCIAGGVQSGLGATK